MFLLVSSPPHHLFLIFFLLSSIQLGITKGADKTHRLSHLLNPQLLFDINLVIPLPNAVAAASLPTAMAKSAEYLVEHYTPFRLVHNPTIKIQPLSPTRSARFTKNQAACLVFVSVKSKSQVVDLREAFETCFLGSFVILWSNIHNAMIQVVVDHSALKETWHPAFAFNSRERYRLPLHYIILHWFGSEFFDNSYLVLDRGKGSGVGPTLRTLKDFFTIISAPEGIKNLKGSIRAEKRDFRGERISIMPSRNVKGTWEDFWRLALQSFTLRIAHANESHAFGGLLKEFASLHNFTFDTTRCSSADRSKCPTASIIMKGAFFCAAPIRNCWVPPLSLNEWDFYSTLLFSKPIKQPEPFKLSSMTAPFVTVDCVAVLTSLLGSSICMGGILMKSTRKYDIAETVISVFAGLVGKNLDPRGRPGVLYLYTAWLLLTGFISMSYTNILQSIVVAPGVHNDDHTFDDMLLENYTFESPEFNAIKLRSKRLMSYPNRKDLLNDKKFVQLERRITALAERVVDPGNPKNLRWRAYIDRYSEGNRNVLVLAKNKLEDHKWIPEKLGVDLIVGHEKFFNAPLWWYFPFEGGQLFVKSLELLKQMGIVSYFLGLHGVWSLPEMISQDEHREFFGPENALNVYYQWNNDGSMPVSLTDGLVSESFVFFLYGILIAVAGFVVEILGSIAKFLKEVDFRLVAKNCAVSVQVIFDFFKLRLRKLRMRWQRVCLRNR